jgi:hypothetical protein
VFFVSDGTGITAETFGHSVLTQFEMRFRQIRLPFIDTLDKAHDAARKINELLQPTVQRPIVFSTLVKHDLSDVIRALQGHAHGPVPDLRRAAGAGTGREIDPHDRPHRTTSSTARNTRTASRRSTSRWRTTTASRTRTWRRGRRDPGRRVALRQDPDQPVSGDAVRDQGGQLPADPGRFRARQAAVVAAALQAKIFGLTITPERLAEIRNERRAGSKYASLENCRYEVNEAEMMMKREGIRWLSSTTKSIEEISTTILQEIKPDRREY